MSTAPTLSSVLNDAEICRQNGWGSGTRLRGTQQHEGCEEELSSTTTITLTAISPRRCAFDGRLEGDKSHKPDGGWAWSQVGGKDVCSERCRIREEARQDEWAPDSAEATPPVGAL